MFSPSFKFESLIEHDQFTEKTRRNSSGRHSSKFTQKSPAELMSAMSLGGGGDLMRRTRSVDIPSVSLMASVPFYGSSHFVMPVQVGRGPLPAQHPALGRPTAPVT